MTIVVTSIKLEVLDMILGNALMTRLVKNWRLPDVPSMADYSSNIPWDS